MFIHSLKRKRSCLRPLSTTNGTLVHLRLADCLESTPSELQSNRVQVKRSKRVREETLKFKENQELQDTIDKLLEEEEEDLIERSIEDVFEFNNVDYD